MSYAGPTNNLPSMPQSRGNDPSVMPKVIPFTQGWNFDGSGVASVDISQFINNRTLQLVQHVYFYNFDASNYYDLIALDTGQNVHIPASSQGSLPILSTAGRFALVRQSGSSGQSSFPRIWLSNAEDRPYIHRATSLLSEAVIYDGSYAEASFTSSPLADSPLYTLSVWMNHQSAAQTGSQIQIGMDIGRVQNKKIVYPYPGIYYSNNVAHPQSYAFYNQISGSTDGTTPTQGWNIPDQPSPPIATDNDWHHYFYSFDFSTGNATKFGIAVDGVNITGSLGWTLAFDSGLRTWYWSHASAAQTLDIFTFSDDGGFGTNLPTWMAELWIQPGLYLDASVPANIEKFRSSTGKAVDLGMHGQIPTGTSPPCYLSVRPGDPVSKWLQNRGTLGGTLTNTGTPLTLAPYGPPR